MASKHAKRHSPKFKFQVVLEVLADALECGGDTLHRLAREVREAAE